MAEKKSDNNKKHKIYDDNEMADNSDGNKKHKTYDPSRISLKFIDRDRREFYVRVNPTMKLDKVFKTYCAKHGLVDGGPRFLYNGNKLHASLTPAEFGMEDEDEIEVFTEMGGGGMLCSSSSVGCL